MSTTPKDVKAVFLEAVERQDATERDRFLDEACAGDAGLRRRVEELLSSYEEAGDFMENKPAAAFAPTVPQEPITEGPGSVIGPYKLLQEIGEGGFGVVYMAEQTEPLRRQVALKIIKPGTDTREVIARFESERQALALMDHPNVAKVLDAGATDSGRPYFVMELVHGIPITEFCDKNNLAARQRLEMFVDICHAIQHAHQKGIIHRDIKPSNIMVTLHDGKPVPKVIDFGVAKATSQKLTERTLFTAYGQMIGTPVYMSPEQAEMSGLGIDTRSDIYSLGVLLYELLTGKTPLDAQRLRASGYAEMLRIIREEEPPRPSTKVSTMGEQATVIAQHRRTDPRKLRQSLRGELDWIVMKALDKDRNRRYETTNNFADDIERFLSGEAVQACPPSTAYLLRKFVRRNKRSLALGVLSGVTVLALVGFFIGVTINTRLQYAYSNAESQRRRAEEQKTLARRYLYGAQMGLVNRAWEANRIDDMRLRLEQQRASASEADDLRGFEWHYFWRVSQQQQSTLRGHRDRIIQLARSPDGRLYASASDDGTAKLWEAGSGRAVRTLTGHRDKVVTLSFSPDGEHLATGSHDSTVKIWETSTGALLRTLEGHTGFVRAVAYSPDGRWFVSGDWANHARLWDAETFEEVKRLDGTGNLVRGVAFSPDSRLLATCTHQGLVKLWEMPTGKEVELLFEKEGPVYSVAFSPDGSLLATAHGDGKVRLWDVESRRLHLTLEGHDRVVYHVAFSRDGQLLATSSWDQTASLWDVKTGQRTHSFKGHAGYVYCSVFSADGEQLLTGSWDQTIRLWGLKKQPANVAVPLGATSVAFNRAGDRLACAAGRDVKIWNVPDRKEERTLRGHQKRIFSAAFSPDGHWLISHDLSGVIKIWSLESAQPFSSVEGPRPSWIAGNTLGLSPDGKRFAAAGKSQMEVREVPSGRLLFTVPGNHKCVGFSPDGRTLAMATPSASIELRDAHSGDVIMALAGHPNEMWLFALVFSPDGKRLASGGYDNAVKVWDLDRGREVFQLNGHTAPVVSIAFSPDGTRLASASSDNVLPGTAGELILWDAQTGQELLRFQERKHVHSVAFSPDGHYLAAATFGGVLKVWDGTP